MKYQCSEKRFLNDCASHKMEVIKDDGLYRHLRFRKPGTGIYWFDIVTWPGALCINGDCGCYVFSRLSDMFEFFRDDRRDRGLRINASYWSEKLLAPARNGGAKEFSQSKFREAVNSQVQNHIESYPMDKEDYAELWREIKGYIFECLDNSGHSAMDAAYRFEFQAKDGRKFGLHDLWDYTLDDYTFQFIWNCYAIAFGIQMYDKSKAVAKAA